MNKAVQYFSDEYLQHCQSMTPLQILKFLDDFRILSGARPARKKLISIRVDESLITIFKQKAKSKGIPYQTQIQKLMRDWVNS